MDFIDLEEYTLSDMDALIQNEVEENIYLDYKDGRALSYDKITEITKDVSAFANSDGGIIIYGISENKETHKPEKYAPVTNSKITKEWIEQKINLIHRKIDGIRIFPIRIDGDPQKSIYVIKIPRSYNAPHMALDNKYYKRHNFSSDPMEEYEVRDLFNRVNNPQLRILNCSIEQKEGNEDDEKVVFSFKAWITNIGNVLSKDYKLSASFFNLPIGTICSYKPHEGKLLPMVICEYCTKFTSLSKETIYPKELIETGHYQFEVPIVSACDFLDKVYIKLTLLFEGGGKDEMLKNLEEVPTILYDKEEINEFIKQDHADFGSLDII